MRHTACVTIVRDLIRACHLLPTLAVTSFIVCLGWALGWPGARLPGLLVVALAGQLSVGWSNDAHDLELDRASGRSDKPAARGALRVGTLWRLAGLMLTCSVIGSWLVAGWIGGTFHVTALLAAWAYNLRLSRTWWSWAPYVVAFGCVPAFLSYGLDGRPPAWWLVVVAALIGLSGHLANASADIEADARAGQGGLAVRLGLHGSLRLCWAVLTLACALLVGRVLMAEGWAGPIGAVVVVGGLASGLIWSRSPRRPRAPFHAVLAVTAVNLLVLIWVVRTET